MLKSNHGIAAANSTLIDCITTPEISDLIKDIANKQSKGDKYATEALIDQLRSINVIEVPEYEEEKLHFFKNDYSDKNSIIRRIEKLDMKILKSNPHVHEIEENTEAITILNRFQKDQCIVCDNAGIDWKALVASKNQNRTTIIAALDDSVKGLIENIINLVPSKDPFNIKQLLIEAISEGSNKNILALLEVTNAYKDLYWRLVLNDLASIIANSDLPERMEEYKSLVDKTPEITDEDNCYNTKPNKGKLTKN